MQVIGTAGHVDHGKSTLIHRLTGINPDRLKAEQDREMSIELGFAWFELPNGEEVGIVDVPGHRDFIENMLAGIGGIDAALFVIAADEGIMPQTREHLAILNLLQISSGIIVLTKIDLVDDQDWLDLVEAEVRETLEETVLVNAPVVRVSARSGEGITDLVQALQTVLSQQPHRVDLGRPRLPIDRVFTLPGFGTIVTGTLMDGRLSVGDQVEILPSGRSGRVRSLQTHKQAEESALPGSRTAVNVSGLHVDQVERGNVLVHPDTYQPTKMIDVWCSYLTDASSPLKHNTEIKFYLGTAEIMARVRLLGVNELHPGQDAFLQLILQEPVVALRQDRFIIRRPSPPATIGGGKIVDALPKFRHKRFNQSRLEELERLLLGTPGEILHQTAQKIGPTTLEKIIEATGMENSQANSAAKELINNGKLIALKKHKLILTAETFTGLTQKIENLLEVYHKQFPLQSGMPREQLKSQLGLSPSVFDSLISKLVLKDRLKDLGPKLCLSVHRIAFSDAQQEKINMLLGKYNNQPYTPPSVKESEEDIGKELLNAVVETGQLIRLGEDVLFQPEAYQTMQTAVIAHIKEYGSITLAELRDHFNTSRKYAVAVLEYLDQIGVTIRREDSRHLK